MSFIVAIDGPAGSGKGTVTKKIAKEMNLINLDTGATYRCVALETLRRGYNLNEEEKIIKMVDELDIQIKNDGEKDIIILNGEDVTYEIRSTPVTKLVSPVSSIIAVREKMVNLQRKLAEGKDVIVEGRDIGTVVFPNANLKIYLDADEEIRAKRRYDENIQKGINMNYEEVLESIRARDKNDKEKKVGALKQADDAIYLDTSNLSIDEVVRKIEELMIDKKKG